ncbi:hypothetical protein AVEN_59577-1 [Araneus ventricosus]|uniref:Uncharacterized protein n=1 Tax=Araneus ventricosus TaxID=182803 RepID=A0A4Y2WDJ4_ARAVE|nr:hypothetical protein AVEN_64861-1 [Araneus ventricosus]GBO35525.1 hypothetical protein AVEN_59577-1 [Araneus ventricosus]
MLNNFFISYKNIFRGSIVATTDEKEAIVYGEIDASYVVEVREQIPILHQKRNDLYHIEYKPFDLTSYGS